MIMPILGEGRKARMHVGDADTASEPPAGGWGHDSQPAFPAEELWTELHPQDEDRPAGTTNMHTDSAETLFRVLKSISDLWPQSCWYFCIEKKLN